MRATSLGLAWSRLVSLGLAWSRLVPLGPAWSRLVPLGPAWSRLVSLGPAWSRPAPFPRRRRPGNSLIAALPCSADVVRKSARFVRRIDKTRPIWPPINRRQTLRARHRPAPHPRRPRAPRRAYSCLRVSPSKERI
ncbi:hypothetical protein DF161_22605 [Burkholderia stagnalis]|nr:hypothetical protein DF161_22605 [Burkholderia stagnalis]RQQ28324.1 hypothetical protein DF148_26140 [Burkholderia stagnalis]RQY32810.1 hypothetical protein DF116_26000 [Burkholderia stagnalis]RQY50876.1 hypothetical protein DF111_27440 [Burkholderia stagnalis]